MKLLDSKIKGSIITFTFEGGQTLKAENYGNGNKIWYLNGKYHREDGPAIERADGTKYWFLNGKYHREDGPAIEFANGSKHWYLNGKRHREDGPAIEYANGDKEWYLNDEILTEDKYDEAKMLKKLKQLG
jgi:hypothetical protein